MQEIYNIASRDKHIVYEDGDYGFIPNYYVNIEIGDWDKPFKVTKNNKENQDENI